MRTGKQRKPILHKPSTLETFYCLQHERSWLKLLLEKDNVYNPFLDKILTEGFYENNDERTTIKKIASSAGFKTDKVTTWIAQIYENILNLNWDEPDLFKTDGIHHELYFKYYDSKATLNLWLPQSPKLFERFTFHFIKAKMGTYHFWVNDVSHDIEDGKYMVHLTLSGHERNMYREWLVDRALFTGVLHFMDTYQKQPFEIDKELLEWHKR